MNVKKSAVLFAVPLTVFCPFLDSCFIIFSFCDPVWHSGFRFNSDLFIEYPKTCVLIFFISFGKFCHSVFKFFYLPSSELFFRGFVSPLLDLITAPIVSYTLFHISYSFLSPCFILDISSNLLFNLFSLQLCLNLLLNFTSEFLIAVMVGVFSPSFTVYICLFFYLHVLSIGFISLHIFNIKSSNNPIIWILCQSLSVVLFFFAF